MKLEKFSHRQLQDYAIKKRLSRYYIYLQMHRPPHRRYYGTECCTLNRIVFRKLQSVAFDGERGLQNCKELEQRYRGQYSTATIYQRDTAGEWQPFIAYAHGLAPVHHLPPAPAPVVKMRVVHNNLEGSITFFKEAA